MFRGEMLHDKMSQDHLLSFLLTTQNQQFSKDTLLLVLWNGILRPQMNSRCAHSYTVSHCFYTFLEHKDGEGNGNPLQYSCLENPIDGGAWQAAVHGVAQSQTRLSDFTFTFHFHALEKEMATHSSVLAWRIPGTGEPGGLPSLGSHKVGHD